MRVYVAIAALAAASLAQANLSFDFASETGSPSARILFQGNPRTVSFPNASTGFDFVIQSSSAASLLGLKGNIDGDFKIGAITINGGLQTAPVTGTGVFSVFDGTNTLTATLSWNTVFSYGTTVGLNEGAAPNVTSVSYTGSNAGLVQLRDEIDRTLSLSTQFVPAKTLTQLMQEGAVNSSSFSGSYYSVVPEPVTFIAFGALALLAMRRRHA